MGSHDPGTLPLERFDRIRAGTEATLPDPSEGT
jgi:hypothetical protein